LQHKHVHLRLSLSPFQYGCVLFVHWPFSGSGELGGDGFFFLGAVADTVLGFLIPFGSVGVLLDALKQCHVRWKTGELAIDIDKARELGYIVMNCKKTR